MVGVRLPRDLVKQIDHLAVDMECSRQAVVELLLREGLRLVKAGGGWVP